VPSTYSTPPQIAERLGVSPEKVQGWCASGKLRAVNVSDGSRPRWKISPEALEEFLAGRESRPQVKPVRRRRRAENMIQFF